MKTHPLTIHLPDGSTSTIKSQTTEGRTSLADFLEQHDYSLNTRCGGRGLCRGCQVTCTTNEGSETFRSCQRPVSSLPDAPLTLEIPNGSWHNQTLYGVSFFDIRLPIPSERTASQALVLAISLMARKYAIPVVPHVGDMGQIHQHLVLYNHIGMGHEALMLEQIPHFKGKFKHPCIVENGLYHIPQEAGNSSDFV
jgi:hypothetical protein